MFKFSLIKAIFFSLPYLFLFIGFVATFLSADAHAQGLPIKSGATSDLMTVDTNKNARVGYGKSTRATYRAVSVALVTTALFNLSIESSAGQGFTLAGWCVGVTNATAAAGVTISVNRRTTASSGGTALTAEGTGNDSVSKMDPADGNFPGTARRTGTLGTIGALIDGQGYQVGELGAGAADPPGYVPICRTYGGNGEKMPEVSAGVANGISINVTAPGAGGLAFGSISAVVIVD